MAYFGIGLVPASWLVLAIRSADRDWRITQLRSRGWTAREIATFDGRSWPTIVDRRREVRQVRLEAMP
jgi:hypothetical protein